MTHEPTAIHHAAGPPAAGTGTGMLLNSPLDAASLDRLLEVATAQRPARVLDHGCGWGEVLLRALEHAPLATGRGVEIHEPDVRRARAQARERGLEARAGFTLGSSADFREPADLLVSLGAYQAFGDVPTALRTLREDLTPGGRAVFGAEYWQHPPTSAELECMWPDASPADCSDLPDLVDAAHAAGWRVLDLHDSTLQEFDAFELGHLREREAWLVAQPEQPDGEDGTAPAPPGGPAPAAELRRSLDQSWTVWLRGRRRPLGFVTLVLG